MAGKGSALALVALAGGALVLLGGMGSASASTPPGGGTTPPAPKPTPIPQSPSGHGLPGLDPNLCSAEPNIPPAVMAVWNSVQSGMTQGQWTTAANTIQAMGYPLLANCLRQQAPSASPDDPTVPGNDPRPGHDDTGGQSAGQQASADPVTDLGNLISQYL